MTHISSSDTAYTGAKKWLCVKTGSTWYGDAPSQFTSFTLNDIDRKKYLHQNNSVYESFSKPKEVTCKRQDSSLPASSTSQYITVLPTHEHCTDQVGSHPPPEHTC